MPTKVDEEGEVKAVTEDDVDSAKRADTESFIFSEQNMNYNQMCSLVRNFNT